ncbi:MAG: DUF932 domain-containing protein [Candidatus Competibacteraceae bacterium]|nr:DUF932 domain-containing protein [Candidatus Competibacteraceae bacterium]
MSSRSPLAARFGRVSGFRADRPLTEEEMQHYAPSVFATEAHGSRSARYTYIPTIEVLRGLGKEGFQPFSVVQARTRIEDRRAFTKHMIRLRYAGQINAEEAHEVILINSHDGSSSYQMLAGLYRFVCANGLVIGEQTHDVRVPHKGDIIGRVVEGAFEVLEDFKARGEQVARMRALPLDRFERQVFAEAALVLRFEEGQVPVTTEQVLTPRRWEDRREDLWTTFNVTQENLVRGGLRGINDRGRRTTTRAVQGIDGNVRLNRALWLLAERMQALKSAA